MQPIGCTLARVTSQGPSSFAIDALSGAGGPDAALHRAVADIARTASIRWTAHSFDGPYCTAVDLLRSVSDEGADPMAALGMSLKGNATQLRKDDYITMEFTMPDFPAHLQIDYLASDGSMTHLIQDDGAQMHIMTTAGWGVLGPSRAYAPGMAVPIGQPDPKTGKGSWQVDQPFGTDMIMAYATSAPLFTALRPADDTPAAYYRDLQAALAALRVRGGRVAGSALLLATTPK
ncbi:MAG: hypothetical protein KGJ41_01805 [Rhodospirillales bacterium]|nr:hypothetical protein [Rhodospirillales bacterium]